MRVRSDAKHPSDRQSEEQDSSLPPDRWSKTLRAGRSFGLRLVENDIDAKHARLNA